MIRARITINKKDASRVSSKLENMEDGLLDITGHLVQITKQNMQNELLSRTEGKPKTESASKIRSKRISKNNYVITMPRKLDWYDRMKPHYVPLHSRSGKSRSNTNIYKWTKKYYGTLTISNRSRVTRGPRGGLHGYIWVTPHPFVTKSIEKSRSRFIPRIKGLIRQVWKKRNIKI